MSLISVEKRLTYSVTWEIENVKTSMQVKALSLGEVVDRVTTGSIPVPKHADSLVVSEVKQA